MAGEDTRFRGVREEEFPHCAAVYQWALIQRLESERDGLVAWVLKCMFWPVSHGKLTFIVFTSTHFDSWERHAQQTILREQIHAFHGPSIADQSAVCQQMQSPLLLQDCIDGTSENSPMGVFFRKHKNGPSSSPWGKNRSIFTEIYTGLKTEV